MDYVGIFSTLVGDGLAKLEGVFAFAWEDLGAWAE